MAAENIMAALDIGTTKIVALVGEMDDEGKVYVIGHGQSSAEGLRRGVVVDMEKAVRSIRKAIDDAQMISGTEIDRVSVGIAGEHIRSVNSHGVVAVNRSDNEITAADVKKAIDAARNVAIPVDREIIHVIPQEFSVDDQSGIKDPVGMCGVRLEVEVHIVTASVTTSKNIYRSLERCRLTADQIILEGLAAREAILTDEEAEVGVVVVDIGGDLTNIAIFHEGAIHHAAVVGLGGKNVTSDIAIGLRTSLDRAEQLKLGHGSAMAALTDAEEMIEVRSMADRPAKSVSCNVLASIIEPRMEEIFSLVAREIRQSGFADVPQAGMVLSGGGALMKGVEQLAEQIFDMPIRRGQVGEIEHTPDDLTDSRYITAHGLLLYGFRHEPFRAYKTGSMKRALRKFENWILRQF